MRRLALSREDLTARPEVIDEQGWDGPTGRELLMYVRENLVQVQVSLVGMSGPVGEQAEATGWAVAWEMLRSPAIRSARLPWSLLRSAVRRAVRNEWVAAAYLTNPRDAWDLKRDHHGRHLDVPAPMSLDVLVAGGYDRSADCDERWQPVLVAVVELLVEAGWDLEVTAQVVIGLAAQARLGPEGPTAAWRRVAAELGLPPWQVRRVGALMCGVDDWPGVVRQLINADHADIRDCPKARALGLATLDRMLPVAPVVSVRWAS